MKKLLILIVVLGGLWLAYYLISPIFNTVEVNEDLPEDIILSEEPPAEREAPAASVSVTMMDSGVEKLSEERQVEFNAEMEKMAEEEVSDIDEPMPDMPEGMEEEEETPAPAEKEAEEEPTPPAIQSFSVMPTRGHPASGMVKVLQTTSGSVIRYENLDTINGPKLHIYLANDLEATDYVDLGPIKGTKGNINYTVPEGIDVSQYQYVMHWCEPFGVLFNYSEINP